MALGGRLPGGSSRAARRAKAVAFVVLITVAAALSSPAGSLYAQVYPDASTTVVTDRNKWQRAYAKASLRTDHPERLVENEAARFTATIVYGRDLDPGRTIDVAYANDATLRSVDPDKAHVVPRTGERQNLDEGTPDGRGGLQLTWEWDVTPRSSGVLTLTLEIQPFVVLGDQVVDKLARRNESIRIDVEVHPNRARFDSVVTASDQEFAPTIPPKFTAEKDTVVTADLPLRGQGDAVDVMLTIVSGEGSVPLTIKERAPPAPSPDSVHSEWIVRAAKEGVAKLTVAAVISTKIGDTSLEKRVERPLVAVVDPAPSFWPTVLSVAGGITTVLGLLAALFVFHTQYRKPLSWLKSKLRRGKGSSGPRPPEAGYM